ncbi:MAG: BamA/TamA family outer membrane protein [Cyanobacteria bacterium RI_101]|nr:BamA/TamA family outer membrane protein [Cyanobacteria bacterium RI_101]
MINRWIRGTGNAILAVGLLLLPGLPAPAQLPPAPEPQGEEAPAPILRGVRLTGNTAFAAADLRSLWEPLLNQPVTEAQLEGLAQGITQRYLEAGYLNSRARVDSFSPEGVAILSVREGELGTVVIEGAPRLETYIRDRVALGAGRPLNIRNLETQLRLLKANPLFKSIDASLRPPETALEGEEDQETAPESNKTDLIVRVVEANPVFGQVGLDNYSPPSIGAVQLSLSAGYRNPTGLGDTVFVSYRPRLEAFLDSYRLDTFYQVPLNPQDGTLAFSVFIDRNKILTDEFTPLNIRGNSDRYVVEYRQPLIRTPDEEFALSFGVSYDSGQTFALDQGVPFGFGPNAEGYSESSPLLFTQDYTVRDSVGVWALRSQFKFGTGLFGATNNPAPIPDGYFFAWLGQVQRLRQFSENNFLIMQLDTQFSANPLLPMEQFVIGGAQSVRGYRQNVLAGDNGIRFSIEDRIALAKDGENRAVFTLAPFFDFGAVWNAAGNPNQLGANKNMLAALGLGLIYQPIAGLTLRVDYAPPLINLNIRGNNIQDDGLYLGINYEF